MYTYISDSEVVNTAEKKQYYIKTYAQWSIEDPALAADEKLAVILGTEGDGLMASTIEAADYTVKIPMYHGVDSLNVGAAAAVAFWELRKK